MATQPPRRPKSTPQEPSTSTAPAHGDPLLTSQDQYFLTSERDPQSIGGDVYAHERHVGLHAQDIASRDIPAAVLSFRTDGFANPGDGGDALYRFAEDYVLSPETESLVASMSVVPSRQRQWMLNRLVARLKDVGLWDKGVRIWNMMAHDAQACLVNWKEPGVGDLSEIGDLRFTQDRGLDPNGNEAYLATGFVPSSAHETDLYLAVLIDENYDMQSTSGFAFGNTSSGSAEGFFFRPHNNSETSAIKAFTQASQVVPDQAVRQGFFALRRSGSNVDLFVNGNSAYSQTASATGVAANPINLLRAQSNAGILQARMCFAFIGQGITDEDHRALYEIVTWYHDAVKTNGADAVISANDRVFQRVADGPVDIRSCGAVPGVDMTDMLQAAINIGLETGQSVFIPNLDGWTMDGSIRVRPGINITGDATVRCNNRIVSFYAIGQSSRYFPVAVQANAGDLLIEADASISSLGLQRGDYVKIISDYVIQGNQPRKGEIVEVFSENSGFITLRNPLADTYLLSDNARIQKVEFIDDLDFGDIKWVGYGYDLTPSSYGDWTPHPDGGYYEQYAFAVLQYVNRIRFSGAIEKFPIFGFYLSGCMDLYAAGFTIKDVDARAQGKPFSMNEGCRNMTVDGQFYNVGTPIDAGGRAWFLRSRGIGSGHGVTDGILLRGQVFGAMRRGAASHEASRNVSVENLYIRGTLYSNTYPEGDPEIEPGVAGMYFRSAGHTNISYCIVDIVNLPSPSHGAISANNRVNNTGTLTISYCTIVRAEGGSGIVVNQYNANDNGWKRVRVIGNEIQHATYHAMRFETGNLATHDWEELEVSGNVARNIGADGILVLLANQSIDILKFRGNDIVASAANSRSIRINRGGSNTGVVRNPKFHMNDLVADFIGIQCPASMLEGAASVALNSVDAPTKYSIGRNPTIVEIDEDGNLRFEGLPTSAPTESGAVWRDSSADNVLKVVP